MTSNATFTEPRAAELADAAKAGDADRVRELVAAGADPNARGAKGLTLLQWAMLSQQPAGVEALLAAGADPARGSDDGQTAVHLAAQAERAVYLDLLLEHGASPDTPNTVTGATPLVAALMAEREANFDALLKAGARVDAADRMGNTPLHQAAKINESARVLQLLEAGADPQAKNGQGDTFQRYLFMTPDKALSAQARRGNDQVRAWLRAHAIPIQDAATQ